MKLIVGLGNPGKEYENTRHNIGFTLVSALAKKWDTEFKGKSKFKAEIAEITRGDEKALLIKPTTFYNNVGESVRAVRDFYKLKNAEILVIHDEMALPFGTLRVRMGGRHAGNNGVKSLNNNLGYNYARLRVGIWNDEKDKIDATAFVLADFLKSEEEVIQKKIIPAAEDIAIKHIRGNLEASTM